MPIDIQTFLRARRSSKSITLSNRVWRVLEQIRKNLATKDGGEYRISWLIEDIILYVLCDERRFEDFIKTMYEVPNHEKEGKEGEKEKKG